jgi:hypothetical protein
VADETMFDLTRWLCCSILLLAASIATVTFSQDGSVAAEASQAFAGLPGKPMMLTATARQALQASDKAFPSETAGFSAYYRVGKPSSYSLDKSAVDDYIFSSVESGDTSLRTAPATLVDVGQNYTVAKLTLQNIDDLESELYLYYDDEGWIVAYLDNDEASALVWQAKGIDPENPSIDNDDIDNTILLDAINIVLEEALGEAAIKDDDDGLGYYHWQFPNADNFLMMAVSRDAEGEETVQFAVADSLTLFEISANLWISQSTNSVAPCASVTLDDSDLIAEQCSKGIYSGKVDLEGMADTVAHTWKLTQSEQDEGGSGSLMVIIYGSSS